MNASRLSELNVKLPYIQQTSDRVMVVQRWPIKKAIADLKPINPLFDMDIGTQAPKT